MARLYILVFLVQVVLAVCALISCLSAEEDGIRHLPRIAWVLIILFFPLVGSIAWFVAGRERKTAGTPASWGGAGRPAERARPAAPDDDPEFLRSIEERSREEDQELFRRWEEDLRKREDDLRRREGEPPREEPRPEA
ncbi:PLDc_N domain-containing protein [Micromonospora sp. Llam7]|uniref:PLD nuclease N-terminal domain-containing protein n=1 Tax=Micromonospora tarapacensis TaxID=2835305 RepID=UPI001C830BEA|nr:PLD nuclease N-terminal domain-containing protein [Micromonospora tarapacensis]MBX7268586.1 PLDc_N domain-containing protein [Micromonospora tarapacensis]